MCRFFGSLSLLTVFASGSIHAQDVSAFVQEAKQSYDYARDNILKSAEKMPESAYGFQPANVARTFGELIAEAARSQAEVCAAVVGSAPEQLVPFRASKPELLAALRSAAGKCNAAYSSVNRFNANSQSGFGSMRRTRLGLLFLNAGHLQQLYGQIAVYLELKGFIPPSRSVRPVPID